MLLITVLDILVVLYTRTVGCRCSNAGRQGCSGGSGKQEAEGSD